MRKIIRYLADISGVSSDIREENVKYIGGRIKGHAFWFPKKSDCRRILSRYGEHMYDYGNMPDVSEVKKDFVTKTQISL